MKNILCLALLLISFVVFGQSEKNEKDYIAYNEIKKLEDSLIYDYDVDSLNFNKLYISKRKILDKYNQFISDYPNSEYLFNAYAEKASNEFYLNEYNNAKISYLKILKLIDENKTGRDINTNKPLSKDMRQVYLNTIYHNLAKIELENKQYSEAIKFLDKENEYPFPSTCGNAVALDSIIRVEMYTQCYSGLNEIEKALDMIIPIIIEDGLVDNSELVEIAYKILLKNYSKKTLKIKFEESFKNLIIKKEKHDNYEYETYSIRFLERSIKLPIWDLIDANTTKERSHIMKKILSSSKFYALLSK